MRALTLLDRSGPTRIGHLAPPLPPASPAAASPAAKTRFEIISDSDAFRALRPDWEALFQRVPGAFVTQTFDWCRGAWEIVAAPRARELFCLVGYEEGRLTLIWPLVRYRHRLWRVIRPLGTETTEYTSLLIEADRDADERAAQALRFLRRVCGADVLLLNPMPEHLPIARAVARLRTTRTAFRDQISYVRWRDLGGWDAYIARLGGDARRRLRSQRRRLAATGRLESVVVDAAGERRALIEWMLDQKRDWASRTGAVNLSLTSAAYRDLHLAIASNATLAARHAFFALTLDGRIIAGALVRLGTTAAEGAILTFDPAFAKFSPGQLLVEDTLRWACERRLDFDFRLGREPYKRLWATDTGVATTYCIANSVSGNAFVGCSLLRLKSLAWRSAARRMLADGIASLVSRGARLNRPPRRTAEVDEAAETA